MAKTVNDSMPTPSIHAGPSMSDTALMVDDGEEGVGRGLEIMDTNNTSITESQTLRTERRLKNLFRELAAQ
eukprot:18031-Eustigmatos_ZCMA.PRE.1